MKIDCDDLQDLLNDIADNRKALKAQDKIMDEFYDGSFEYIKADAQSAILEDEYNSLIRRLNDAGYDEP